jgi:hypothetical protein
LLTRALATGRKNKARLVIAKLDRLFRNLVFVAALMDSGIEFVAVDNLRYPHVQSNLNPKSPPPSPSSERRVGSTTFDRSISGGSGSRSKMSEFIVTIY